MKIIIKIPQSQEQKVMDAFTVYSNLNPDQTENLKLNILGFVQNVYVGMQGAKEIQVVVKAGETAVEAIPVQVTEDAKKLSVESGAI